MPSYKGWKAFIYADIGGTYAKVGYSESVTIDVATGLEPYYEHGSRRPVDLTEGNEEITATMSRAWFDALTISELYDADGASGIGEFMMYLYIYDTGAPWIYLYYCKIESSSFDIPQDGFIMNDIDFRALYLIYGVGA